MPTSFNSSFPLYETHLYFVFLFKIKRKQNRKQNTREHWSTTELTKDDKMKLEIKIDRLNNELNDTKGAMSVYEEKNEKLQCEVKKLKQIHEHEKLRKEQSFEGKLETERNDKERIKSDYQGQIKEFEEKNKRLQEEAKRIKEIHDHEKLRKEKSFDRKLEKIKKEYEDKMNKLEQDKTRQSCVCVVS